MDLYFCFSFDLASLGKISKNSLQISSEFTLGEQHGLFGFVLGFCLLPCFLHEIIKLQNLERLFQEGREVWQCCVYCIYGATHPSYNTRGLFCEIAMTKAYEHTLRARFLFGLRVLFAPLKTWFSIAMTGQNLKWEESSTPPEVVQTEPTVK